MIEQIQSVAVVVSDEKKAKEGYKNKMGFEVQSDEEHWMWLLHTDHSSAFTYVKANHSNPATPASCYLPEIREQCRELKKEGVEFSRELGKAEWDEKTTYAMFKDPDGEAFSLVPKQQWWQCE